jgi:hypothetical protein
MPSVLKGRISISSLKQFEQTFLGGKESCPHVLQRLPSRHGFSPDPEGILKSPSRTGMILLTGFS